MGADASTLAGAANPQKNGGKLNWMSNLSVGYIKKLKERFEYAQDDFTLDEAALKNYFKCTDKEVQILFDYFDADGSGKIDSYELTCAMALLSDSDLDGKAELIFSLYDFDGNKYITRDELVILMTNVLSSLNAMKSLPAPKINDIEAKTDQFFKGADANSDQRITLKEFKDYITKDKDIMEVLLSTNVAKREDLGTDFGSGDSIAPDVDKDLEAECNPKALQYSRVKQNVKAGIDPAVTDDGVDEALFKEEAIAEGDQFMAVKPWVGVVKNSVPSNYKPNKRDGEAPDASLQLEYIYGYRCHDARNNLRYTSTGEVVYHAAAAGIVLNQKTNTQRFFIQHTDDIHCMAIDPTGKFCATGEIGPKPLILVWNNETMECIARIQGTLTKGIKNLAFSRDGKLLAASAFDDDHCIAVYQLGQQLKPGQTIAPIATGKGTRAQILSLGFNPLGTELVGTCVKEVDFFSFAGGLIKKKVGTGWTNNQQSVLCQAYLGDTLYTGLFDGSLVAWSGTAIKSSFKAHTDGVHSLYARQNNAGLISGGGDGLIIFWSPGPTGLQQTKQIDIKVPEVKSMLPKVRSVCENPTTGQVLVGTRGGEIIEFGGPKPLILMRSHFDGELWGLATHPGRQEFVTVGNDCVLGIWDIKTRKQKRFGKLEQAANVAAFSNNGVMLAIGYTNGAFHIIEPDNKFTLKANIKNRKEAISDIKFNPQDTILAVAAHDSCIILYDVVKNFARTKVLRGHHSTVAHIDFSLDGNILMSNCTSYEILFFDCATGKRNPSGASAYRNETWATWSCSLGWPVQGIFPPFANGTDINAVDRSPDGIVCATADDFGKVKLFKYPNPVEKAGYQQYVGHSSHVTNVRFVKQIPYLVSTGGEDKCIFQWKYFLDKESAQQSLQAATKQVNLGSILDDIPEPPKLKAEPTGKPQGPQLMMDDGDDAIFQEQAVAVGDQAMAVKPFKGQVDASTPDIYKKPNPMMGAKPEGNLKLKYAHGFRSFDTRGNLKYVNKDHIVFTTAALGVVMNKTSNVQNFFNLHEEDVVALTLHPGKDIVATGQMAAKGKAKMIDIFVWQISTGEVLAHLNNFHRGAIRKLAFSPAGDKLLSIGEDEKNSVAIYDWASKRVLCSSPVDPDKVMDACWKDETEFATVGLKHVKFFNIQGINITMSKGLYGPTGVTPMISCAYAFKEQVFLTGTATGELVMWNGRSIGKTFKQHADALWQIISVENNTMLMTGGNDGKVILWDRTLTPKQSIDIAPMSKFPAGIRSLDYLDSAKTLLVGTRGAEIIEVNAANGAKLKTHIYGHFSGVAKSELWGCAVHPTEQIFATCGADKTIRLWKDNQMLMASDQFANDLTAVDWSTNGQFLIAGDYTGFIHLIDPKTLKSLGSSPSQLANKPNAWIEDLKISPDSQIVAFGTHGGLSSIDLVKVIDGKQLQKLASVNLQLSSAILHLDWSSDGQTIMVVSQAYELMWLNMNTKKQLPASSAKSIQDDYHTFTNIFGWQVKGIWPPFTDYTHVNSTCRSHSRAILATADDLGKVKLFKYPCVVDKGAQYNEYMGHSSHVTKCKFSAGDTYLVTTGGHDKTVLIWETDFGDGLPKIQSEEQKASTFEVIEDEMDSFRPQHVDLAKSIKLESKAMAQAARSPKKQAVEQFEEASMFEVAETGVGDEFSATLPWLGQMRAPSNFIKPPAKQNTPPQIDLELEWVHGYRCRDTRNNIGIVQDESIIYQAAGLGVGYDPSTHTQRFMNTHIDDVTAIAFSPDKRLVATGEIGAKPMICIWDAITMQLKFPPIKGKLTKGIQSLSFSNTGKTLAAVAIDPDHSVAVINVETGTVIGSAKGDVNEILDIAMKDDLVFSTAGIKHFKQWTVSQTGLIAKSGQFGTANPAHGVCRYMGEQCLSGAITGELYVWAGTGIKQKIKLHQGHLDAITVTSKYVLTGGKDCRVNILQTGTLTTLHSFSLTDAALGFNSICGKVRAIALNDAENIMYLGTLGAEVYQVGVNIPGKSVTKPKRLVVGHYSPSAKYTNEVWGLEVTPDTDKYITTSDDGTLRVWDAKLRSQIQFVNLAVDPTGQALPMDPATNELSDSAKARCVDVKPSGEEVAVGFLDGSVRIYAFPSFQEKKRFQVVKKLAAGKNQVLSVSQIRYSPDSSYLAVASHDAKVHIFSTADYSKKATCSASTSAVTHIDWSIDSQVVHTNDLSYELLYYNALTGQQDKGGASAYKDEPWATWTLPLGWPVQGIWPTSADGSDINSVDRTLAHHIDGYQLIASGDDKGKVKVFRYPSMQKGSQPVEGKGHSSHVTNVRFAKNDITQSTYLYSTGGNDTCVFQWKVLPKK